MKAFLSALLFPAILLVQTSYADVSPPVKSGISLTLEGQEGVDFAIEDLYHDPLVFPRRVIYLKANTKLKFTHNNRNVLDRNDLLPSNDQNRGQIRYKVDQERQWRSYTGGANPSYGSSVSLSQMRYADNSQVVGSVGDNGNSPSDLTSYWTKGVLDSFGDEWHTVLVWDDDSWRNVANEYKASDGIYHVVVVNPKTPAIRWITSGNGQFYTTPAKNYWIPKIYDQVTYLQGNVTCELRDINGNNVFYRINGGNFINAGANHVQIAASQFTVGENILEYYYAGQTAHTKTRKVVRDPAFPSAGENHGNLMWVNDQGWQKIRARLNQEPYKPRYERYEWDSSHLGNGQSTWGYRDLRRKTHQFALPNALVAKNRGNEFSNFIYNGEGSTKPYAEFAKEMVLDNARTMDATGYEAVWPGEALPNKEQFYRGYWDVDTIYSQAFAYDLLVSQYRSDQHPNGLTPIEDYFIRDCLASWAWECLQVRSGMSRLRAERGMWGNMRSIGGIVCGMVMPTYSTPYYGTSGFDNQSTQVYPWCPFPDTNYTWKQGLFDPISAVNITGYPNMHYQRLLEQIPNNNDALFDGSGNWGDKIGYLDLPLCGHSCMILGNLSKQYYPTRDWPEMFLGFDKATRGQLIATGSGTSPYRRAMLLLMNGNFPELTERNLPWIKSRPSGDKESFGPQLFGAKVYGLIWYDHTFSNEGGPVDPPEPPQATTETPVLSPSAGTYQSTQQITLSSATEGAEIYYTVDGTVPQTNGGILYDGPFTVQLGLTTVRAIAVKDAYNDSSERVATYTIGNFVAQPTISPGSGNYIRPQTVSIATSAGQASIHYTTDGSTPSASSPNYSGPIQVGSDQSIRAIAVLPNGEASEITTAAYTFSNVITSTNQTWGSWSFIDTDDETFQQIVSVTPGSAQANTVVGFSDNSASTWSDMAVIIRFSPDGKVDARNGSQYQSVTDYSYEAGTAYQIIFDIDLTAKIYSARVREPDGSFIAIAHDYAFRTEQSTVSSLTHLSAWTQNGTTRISVLPFGPTFLRVVPSE